MMIRQPQVAGAFYPALMQDLYEQVNSLIASGNEKSNVAAAVVPHAGLMYSGAVAGKVYSRIKKADTFVLVGPNHHAVGSDFSIMLKGLWRTPLGEVKVDDLLAKEVFKKNQYLQQDPFAHEREHSLEVQLPFIQTLFAEAEIIPITIKHYKPEGVFLKQCECVGESIAEAVDEANHNVVLVASTDFSHYVHQSVAQKKDKKAIQTIIDMDPEKLFKVVWEEEISMCGYAACACVLYAAKKLGAKNAELIEYMTSGDTTGDLSQVVGYAGLTIK
ncbi:MAG: AmmeMemoRadiSam system protein B [Candidatus Altiarchaeales archaeon]|nr:AmmeMemoRadiSam system protein B [Candidatus Altiarchaeales archaeon]